MYMQKFFGYGSGVKKSISTHLWSAGHNLLTLYRGLMQYLNIVILAVGLIL